MLILSLAYKNPIPFAGIVWVAGKHEKECFPCAAKESRESFAAQETPRYQEETILIDIIAKEGKSRVEVNPDGFCLVQAWYQAMCMSLKTFYRNGWKDLLEDALFDLEYRPIFYSLEGQYKEDIDRYRRLGDYGSSVIDLLPYALANVTRVQCLIREVNGGHELSFSILPVSLENVTYVDLLQIELAYFRGRSHYDIITTKEC